MSRRRTALLGAAAAAASLLAAAPVHAATAPGQVFLPNPVADLGIQTLTDQKDTDFFSSSPQLAKAYHRVTLTDLDSSGTLTGSYAKVLSGTGKPAQNTGSGFIYTRDQDQFEQVMGYFWVTERPALHPVARVRQRQQPPAVAAHQPVRRRQLVLPRGHRQAHHHAGQGRRRRRRGRRRDRPRVRPLGAGQPGARLRQLRGGRRDRRGVRRLPGRDRHAAVHAAGRCGPASPTGTRPPTRRPRRTACAAPTTNKQYPGDLVGEVHADGEIWSAALFGINHGHRPRRARTRSSSARSSDSPRRSRCRPPLR